MIVGIGTDIVEVDRIRDSHKKFGEKFIDRILLPAEREYCLSHTDPRPKHRRTIRRQGSHREGIRHRHR